MAATIPPIAAPISMPMPVGRNRDACSKSGLSVSA